MFPIRKPAHLNELWPADELGRLLRESDIDVLCVPLNAQTHGMIGVEQFGMMKPGALFLNAARGQVIVEAELTAALQSGDLGGAGLDVTEVEPLPASSPLWDMQHVLITPHLVAQSACRADVTVEFFCEN